MACQPIKGYFMHRNCIYFTLIFRFFEELFLKRLFCKHSDRIQIILNRSISPIDRNLTYTSTQGQSEPGSNSKEWVLYSPQISRHGTVPSDAV